MQTIDGKQLANNILTDLKEQVDALEASPVLAIVMSGDNSASEVYVRKKMQTADSIGIKTRLIRPETDEQAIYDAVIELGKDSEVDGIIVQLPVPGIDASRILTAIPEEKDVDGLNPINLGKVYNGTAELVSATPLAVMHVLEHIADSEQSGLHDFLTGKHAVIVNRSILFGKPLAALLLSHNATVTVAHSRTKDLAAHTTSADIIITATGQKDLITEEHISAGAIVIDAGFTKTDKSIYGDLKPGSATDAAWLSPVPGGIGPIGVAMLMSNTVKAHLSHLK